MDFLGPFMVAAALWAVQHYKLGRPAFTLLRQGRVEGTVAAQKADFHLKTFFVGKVIFLLFLVSGIQALFLGGSWLYAHVQGVEVSGALGWGLWIATGIAIVLMLAQACLGGYMLPARPAYLHTNGVKQRHPLY